MNLSVRNFALALGITSVIFIMVLGSMSMIFDIGGGMVESIASVYAGFNDSVPGILIGSIWAFIDGFVGGALFAWIYNKLQG